MKDISDLFERYLAGYRRECPNWKAGSCARSGGCECIAPAEVMALTKHLVPNSCFNLHLSSFDGNVPGDDTGFALKPHVVQEAKRILVEYCWGKTPFDETTEFNSPAMLKKSALAKRRALGHSLVIHGNSEYSGNREEGWDDRTFKKPTVQKKSVGRTLLASIVMKEIVRQRLFPGHVGDSYEWVSFPALKSRVTNRDNDAITDYQTADWLVVDGIHPLEKVSDNMRGYQLEKLNTVFVDRTENRLPTILVFQFDITKDVREGVLHEKVGLGISQIVEDEMTFRISLTNQ